MSKHALKNLIILSLIFGLLVGLPAIIPFMGLISLFAVFFLSAPAVIMFLIMAGKFDLTSVKDGIIAGAVTGFCSNITFTGVYCLGIVILKLVTNYNPNIFLTAIITQSPVWLLIICILFIGTATAVVNAFSGFLTYYIINFIRDSYAKKQEHDSYSLYK